MYSVALSDLMYTFLTLIILWPSLQFNRVIRKQQAITNVLMVSLVIYGSCKTLDGVLVILSIGIVGCDEATSSVVCARGECTWSAQNAL